MVNNPIIGAVVVVVVEDDELIRMIAVEAFRDEGFEVLVAPDARAAMVILESEAARVHVIFTDVHMPGTMNGVMLVHHVRRHWPWIFSLVTSGLAHPTKAEMPAGTHFVAKPYNLANVACHIREMAQAA